MTPAEAAGRLRAERVVGILRRVPADRVAAVADALVAGGLGIVEVTLESEDALGALERLRARGGLTVAAGTVRTAADVDRAAVAGAEILFCPATAPPAIDRALARGVPIVPGAYTPTEIEAAWGLGAAAVKLFPGARAARPTCAPCARRSGTSRSWSAAGSTRRARRSSSAPAPSPSAPVPPSCRPSASREATWTRSRGPPPTCWPPSAPSPAEDDPRRYQRGPVGAQPASEAGGVRERGERLATVASAGPLGGWPAPSAC